MGKPNWQNQRRPEQFTPALSNRPSGPRQGDSKISLIKQGVKGPLRAKNLRMLLEACKAPEDLAALAELPLERIQTMAEGGLCSDETAYHIEQQLDLPIGWLDHMASEVPPDVLGLLKDPLKKRHDEEGIETRMLNPTPIPSQNVDSPSVSPPAAPVNAQGSLALEMPSAADTNPAPPSAQAVEQTAPVEPLAVIESSALEVEPPVESAIETSALEVEPPAEPAVALSVADDGAITPLAGQEPPAGATAVETHPPLNQSSETPMNAAELRRLNLAVLLTGKGAKSALARLIGLSPASITSMVNGARPLDKPFCAGIAKALKISDNWFESEKSEADVSDALRKRLAPLVRGSNAPAPVVSRGKASEPPATSAPTSDAPKGGTDLGAAAGSETDATSSLDSDSGSDASVPPSPPSRPAPDVAAPDKPSSWPPAGSATRLSKIHRLTGTSEPLATPAPVKHTAPAPVAAKAVAQPAVVAAAAPEPVLETPAPHVAPILAPAPVAQRPSLASQAGDRIPAAVTGAIADGGLQPIVEALLKTLAQKAQQGAISEDMAFELLGTVRSL